MVQELKTIAAAVNKRKIVLAFLNLKDQDHLNSKGIK